MQAGFPQHLSPEREVLLRSVMRELEASQGDSLLGIMLTGSAARELENDLSDLDVVAILDHVDAANAPWVHRADLEVIPLMIEHIETVVPFGAPEWGWRWTYAWAPILLDRTHGRLQSAVDRQTRLTLQETNDVLVGHARLDAWINLLYRALKSARDGNDLEARLDGAESVAMFLDLLFALHGLVRPYNKYLRWTLQHHPIPGWPSNELLDLVQRTMEGDADAMRQSYARVHDDCVRFDRRHDQALLRNVVDSWASGSYDVLRG